MKAGDQGEMIRKGSDYFTAIASKRKRIPYIVIDEDEDEVDEDKRSDRFQIPHDGNIDKDYCMLLRRLKSSGGYYLSNSTCGIKYSASSGKRVPSNPSGECSSSEFKKMKPEPSNKMLPPSGKRVPSNQIIEGPTSEFRQGVTDILLKPYTREEYLALLDEATLRKPQVRSSETRSCPCPSCYETKMGKSFLDHHIDLEKKIEKARGDDDKPRALQLLRGLFFYLTFACMEDQFEPWNDDKWLEAMNRSTLNNA